MRRDGASCKIGYMQGQVERMRALDCGPLHSNHATGCRTAAEGHMARY